jgi:hypothetical protein
MRAASFLTLLTTSLAMLAPSVPALGQVERPLSAHRVVRLFDFEERAFTTEPVPVHWVRVVNQPGRIERPGFPAWNESGFDAHAPWEGDWSVKLPTRGGSAALRLAAGVVPVVPQADYVVAARVRTDGLEAARARVAARFLDEDLREIADSEQTSELTRTGGTWEPVHVELWGDHADAAWIQVDLLLLQPDEQGGPEEPDLREEDLSGAAWFDQVAILQAPRVEITTSEPTNLVALPDRPTLNVRVRDLTGERLSGEVEVRDLWGRVAAQRTFDLPPGSPATEWAPPIEKLGWYEATLRAVSGTDVVGISRVSFVWSRGETPDPAESARFTILADREPLERLELLPDLLREAGVGGAILAIPDEAPEIFLPPLEEAVMTILERRLRLTLEFTELPAALARRLHIATDDLLAVDLSREADAWRRFFEPALARFGQRVRRWQIGSMRKDPIRRPDLAERKLAFAEAFQRLSPEPIIATPWAAHREIEPDVAEVGALSIRFPTAAPAVGVRQYAKAWGLNGTPLAGSREGSELRPDVTLLIEPREAPAPVRVRQLARRVLHAWKTDVARLAFPTPWRWSEDRRPVALLDPSYAVIRSLSWRLHGREIAGRMPTPDGAHALILRGVHNDGLAVWNEYAAPEAATLEAYLGGDRVRAFDLFGNEVPLESSGGRHRVPIGFDPIFIENVDADLLRFQSGVRLEPGFLTSQGSRRSVELVLENPWPETMTGRVRLTGKEHWRLAPSVHQVAIDPGGELRLPFEISLGVAEESGTHAVAVEAELNVGRKLHRLELEPTLEIGLESVTLDGGVRLVDSPSGGARDVVVVAIVTNVGSEPVTMTAAALAPGEARKQAPISSLAPGDSTVRQFRFDGAAERLGGRVARVTLTEAGGVERLNRTFDVP